jgi:hypothetical protein
MIPQNAPNEQICRYRLPRTLLISAVWSAAICQPRSIAHDARRAVGGITPPPEVLGADHIPPRGPCLVTCNHYSRPDFAAWWIALAISAAVASRRAPDADPDVRWVMTAAWTFPESRWRRQVLTPITRWAFARAAHTYGFVTMPPMPPQPDEAEARATAVLRTVRLARLAAREGGLVGLAPEGMDTAGGRLGQLPKGAGSFIALLAGAGLPVLPVAMTEEDGRLRISFGQVFHPKIPARRAERDLAVAEQVMDAIAHQLP